MTITLLAGAIAIALLAWLTKNGAHEDMEQ